MLAAVLAALLAAPPSGTLIEMTHSLGEAGVLPKTSVELEEIATRSLSPAFVRTGGQWTSEDERCFADFGAEARIVYGCRFASAIEAGTFLRSAATALAHPLRPPFPADAAQEMHHRALMTIDHALVGAEFHVVQEGDEWIAAVILTPGRRTVIARTK